MFNADPTITDLNVREKNLNRVLFSMNIHQVATPELSVEDARCYILFFGEGSNITAYIALYLTRSDGRIYYSYSSNPFPQEGMAQVEDEARGFVEDMGFVLDEIAVAAMSAADKNHWIDEQAIFSRKKQPEVQPAPAAQPPPAAVEPQPQAGKKPVPVAQPAVNQPGRPVAETAPPLHAMRPDSVVSPAVKADATMPPATPQPKKDVRSATGVVGREKEALARLLSSF